MRTEEEVRAEVAETVRLKDDMKSLDLKAVLDIRLRQLRWVLNDDKGGE